MSKMVSIKKDVYELSYAVNAAVVYVFIYYAMYDASYRDRNGYRDKNEDRCTSKSCNLALPVSEYFTIDFTP